MPHNGFGTEMLVETGAPRPLAPPDPKSERQASETQKTRIVIVGGGAGGLELATRLGARYDRKHHDIVLVDRNPTHVWKPLLHEVAAGSLDANLDEVGYRGHCYRWGYRFFLGSMETIERETRELVIAPLIDENGREIVARHRIPYDYLIIAIGSEGNEFGTPGVLEHCMVLETPAARAVRQHRDRRRGRHRRGTRRRALQRRRGPELLRPRGLRRDAPQGDPDRGGSAHPPGATREAVGRGHCRAGTPWGPRPHLHPYRRRGCRRLHHVRGRAHWLRHDAVGGGGEGAADPGRN